MASQRAPERAARRPARRRTPPVAAPLLPSSGARRGPARPTQTLKDSTETFVGALEWLGGGSGQSAEATAERRAEGLLEVNRGLLRELRVEASITRRGGRPGIQFRPGTRIGAVPLASPVSGRPELGLVIEPRISWASAGEMLAGTGFRIVPELLPLPDMPQSERGVPPWVLSSVVIARLERLLEAMQRRFVLAQTDLRSPRGQVNWDTYLRTRVPLGRALDIPCRFPDLRDDEDMRSAVAWTARRHRDALSGQLRAGRVVRELIVRFEAVLARLPGALPRAPWPSVRTAWQRGTLPSAAFRDGLQAIDWTVDERGLAGLTDLSGLAWRLDMETFFEAWVESIAEQAARRTASRLLAGRRGQTRVPLAWRPPSLGSQTSLVPDLVIQRADVTVVVDAKYKRHADQIERLGWAGMDERVREEHRNDVLQALAYSTLFDTPRVVSCLAYPAPPEVWTRLNERGRTVSRTRVPAGGREVELVLMSVPLSGDGVGAGRELEGVVRGGVG